MKYMILIVVLSITFVSAGVALIVGYFFIYIPSKGAEAISLSAKMAAVRMGSKAKNNETDELKNTIDEKKD